MAFNINSVTFDISPVLLSIKVSLLAEIIVSVVGTGAAFIMHRYKIPAKNLIETIIGLPMVLPPTVIGFGLLVLLGRNGFLGSLLEKHFQIRIIFTWWAAVVASAVVSLPLMYRSARVGFAEVDGNLERAARTLGASEWRVFCTISLPLAAPGILAGVFLSFARALGEFGATMMLAGNIPGQTQTIPLAIFFAAESGDIQGAGILVFVITIISFGVTYLANVWPPGGTFLRCRERR